MVKRVAKVAYLMQEALQKKCIHGLLGGRGHWCTAINNVETSQAFMLLLLVVQLLDKLLKQLLQSFASFEKKSQLWPGGTMVGVNQKQLLRLCADSLPATLNIIYEVYSSNYRYVIS